jgi:hypothetical protein
MCQTAINLITNALSGVNNAEALLKIKPVVGLFIQTMDVSWPSQLERTVSDKNLELGILGLHDEQPPADSVQQIR